MDTSEKNKNSKGLVVLVVVLFIAIIGLVAYIGYDKILNKDEKVINHEINKKGNNEEKLQNAKIEDIDINNEKIIELFTNSHAFGLIGIDANIYNRDQLNLEEMTDDYKMMLAARLYNDKIETTEYSSEVKEEYVKNAYEKIFGPNTYTKKNEIKSGCQIYKYDENTKSYKAGPAGCGGATTSNVYEEIIKATKYDDRIEITSAAVFTVENTLYKDYNNTQKLGELLVSDLERSKMKEYVIKNKDNLEKYTYTYKLNDDGFYYYTGVKKVK